MANNVNTNLTQRIFAYISHSDDLNARLAQVYENSLIFVGDEKQIYVPKFGAYVGIGMTSYNNTVGRIDNIAQQLAELKKTMNETAVKKLYVDFGEAAMDGNTQITGGNIFTASARGASIDGTPGHVTGEVIITGKANMNPETFFKNESYYTYSGDDWVNVKTFTDEDAAPTSGIRISYTSDWTQVTLDGGIIAQQPMNQRLVIDDSLTWSYMTHAYSYTLGFTRDYTNTEINKIYQNILGIGSSVLMPVSDESLWDVNPKTGARRWINTNTLYYKLDADAGLDEYADNAKWGTTTTNVTPEGTVINPDPDAPTHPQYYILVTNYDNSYNMNIADGIQTLKEVAYILDIITDGNLGTVTYMTGTEWREHVEAVPAANANNAYEVSGITYHRVMGDNNKPTANETSYGWYISPNTENLGIQIANSIAENAASISDLHDHVALAEEGQTTLRSLSQYNPSQFITMSQWSNRNGLAVTDTNQSLPTADQRSQTAYMIGDVKTMTSLTVASTYITYNGADADYSDTALNGEERIGLYQLVDITKFPTWQDNTYYSWNGTAMVAASSTDWPSSTDPDTLYNNSHELKKFYTKNAGSKAEEHINDTFTYASGAYVDEHTTETFYVYKNVAEEGDPVWKYVEATAAEKSNDSIKKYYIATGGTGADYVLHANTTESNRLATTAWTMALVDDRNANLQSELDGILEEANKYTDDKINALDANYKYSDFASYFNTVSGASSLTYGTTAYTQLWNEQYAAWTADKADNTFTGDHADYVAGYTYNRVRSQYVTNVIEENGMVTAEGRELPTDELKLSYSIWNTQREGAQFTAITLTGQGDNVDNNDVAVEGVEGLFGFVYNNGGTPKEIYYQTGDTYEPWSYVNTTDTPIANLVYLGNDGEYKTVDTSSVNVTYAIQYNITNSPWWPGQIYKLNTAYYEVNVSSIKTSNVGGDAEYITSFEYMGPAGLTEVTLASASEQPTFFAKNVNNNKEVKYLTGHVDHFSYVGDGEGQNRFYVDAHITHIEDAAHDNTGLADAYDVQNYIQNMFSWVNISASIDSDVLAHEADFYTLVQTKAATSEAVNTLINGKTLYYNNAGTFTAVGTPTVEHFAKNAAGNTIVYNANDAVAGSDWYEVSDGGTPRKPLAVYECTETVFTNPMNMTLHQI